MIREILKPSGRNLTIQIPESFVGKTIEVIAFKINEPMVKIRKSKMENASQLKKELAEFSFNSGGYKFSRDEANDYE